MENCMCSSTPTLFFACAGGSNVGQITNDACRQLAKEGKGKLFCLAGIGGHVSGMVETAKSSDKVVAIDGCGVKCALKSLESANVPVHFHAVLTDWGIEKTSDLFPEKAVIQEIKNQIADMIK